MFMQNYIPISSQDNPSKPCSNPFSKPEVWGSGPTTCLCNKCILSSLLPTDFCFILSYFIEEVAMKDFP